MIEKTSASLSIAWEEPSPESHNGILIEYLGILTAVPDAEFVFNMTSNGTNMTLDGLLPHMDYGFQVAALNSIGIGPFSASLLKRTAEDGMLCNKLMHQLPIHSLSTQLGGQSFYLRPIYLRPFAVDVECPFIAKLLHDS